MSRKRFPPTLEVTIDSIDAEGVGSAVFGEKAVRVKGGLPGESLVARTVGRRKGAALAVVESVVESHAAERQTPACAYYPRCGGCALQHMNYTAQLDLKQQGLLTSLAEHEVEFARLRAPVASPQFGYRRKARLGVRKLHEQLLVGFRETFGGRIVKMDACLALEAPFDRLIAPLSELIRELSIPAAIPQLEVATGDTDAALLIRHLEPFNAQDARLLGEFERRHRIQVYTQSAGYDSVVALSREPKLLNYSLEEFGLNLEFSVTDFVQINRPVNALIAQAVVRALRPNKAAKSLHRVGDLFCGIGNFSLPLARDGHQVVGWEAAGPAIERAKSNAIRNRLGNRTEFHVADLYGLPEDKKRSTAVAQINEVDALLLDPPRSGAGPALASWLQPRVKTVVYVSCNPKTFASDAVVLQQHGFDLTEVGVYDMFPHTAHVETLGVFQRRG